MATMLENKQKQDHLMFEGVVVDEPVSPASQYLNSLALSICIVAVVEFEIPFENDLQFIFAMVNDVFLPINPRFSSVMVTDENGVKQWKKVELRLEDHVKVPTYTAGASLEFYDACFREYLTEITTGQLPQSRPMWEIHILTYPTSSAAGNVIFKIHHSLGDGYSLMGALFTCFKRLDNPSLPLTLPSLGLEFPTNNHEDKMHRIVKNVSNMLSLFFNTVSNFTESLLKSTVLEDDPTPIRSGNEGVEFLPLDISNVTFSLDHVKQIKTAIGATLNDVIVGTLFYGVRMYMESAMKVSSKANSTALVLLSTRAIKRYQTCEEMVSRDSKSHWGNQFAFLHVPITKANDVDAVDPLQFVYDAREIIKKRKSSFGFFVTGKLIDMIRRFRGSEVASQYIHRTLRKASMTVTNMIGPIEKIALANYPCKGIYFMMGGSPQSISITMVSYNGKIRLAVGAEKSYINIQVFMSCIENAFERISKAALGDQL
ncbi:hypothetical protein Syun_008453 [Stephania yunnanensis]|uniref:Diacylglycerol O-acyltransferase n=1 Tax=Stephania yunnanensis TaxID=152371 RepID=A0AAP0PPM0_9MAGN